MAPKEGVVVESGRQSPCSAPIPQLLGTIRERIPDPFRFGLYLVLASTPLLAISGEVLGVLSLRTVSELFLFPLLGILAVLVVFKPDGMDRAAFAGFGWGLNTSGFKAKRLRAGSVSGCV